MFLYTLAHIIRTAISKQGGIFMKHQLAKIKEFSYQFLDLLFILEYENIHKDNQVDKKQTELKPLSDSKPSIN